MDIMETVKEVHVNAVAKGFWDAPEWNFSEKLMLIVSELGGGLRGS
jgi:hypothetical protein